MAFILAGSRNSEKKRQSSSSLEWGGDGFVVSREREDKRIKTIQEG